ncbi:MAG: trypsin-like peptidase domain-containing protein, partial [Acidobacteria bacterium]|nr:trypsin-like peptidase domain-containing protein [Acidobacteriota bacterium]
MRVRQFLSVLLIFSAALIAGCRTNLFSGGSSTQEAQSQSPAPPPSPIVVDGMRTSYADVVEKTSPAVVRVDSERKSKVQPQQFPFGDDEFFRQFIPRQNQQAPPQVERGTGSGVIVSADGSVLTNYHVIDGADKITVRMLDGKSFEAKVVGSDQPSDLAVLKVEGNNLPFLTLGNSDSVRIGDIVLAIGNPLGIGQTVT